MVQSDGRVSPIHKVVSTGDEGCFIRKEKTHQRGDLVRAAESAEWVTGNELRSRISGKVGQKRRLDVRRTDAVDSESGRAVLSGGVLRQPDNAMFCRRVGAIANRRHGAVDGRHIDDGAIASAGSEHRRNLVSHAKQDAVQVDVDDPRPVCQVRLAGWSLGAADTGVVDREMQRTVRLLSACCTTVSE